MDALKTAEHQLTHLVEFMIKEDISYLDKSSEQISELHSICSIIIKDSDLDFVKKTENSSWIFSELVLNFQSQTITI